jgi:hypothetical protein
LISRVQLLFLLHKLGQFYYGFVQP